MCNKIGFGVYFVDSESKIKLINFDMISSDLSQTAEAAVRGFRFLREQDFFKEIDKSEYIVWVDCGRHFRNKLLVGYLFKELAQEGIHGNVFHLIS